MQPNNGIPKLFIIKQCIMSRFFKNFPEELKKYQRLETIFNHIEHQTRQINADISPLLHKQAQRFIHHAIILPILLEELLVRCQKTMKRYYRILEENTENYCLIKSFPKDYQRLISKYSNLINQLKGLQSHCQASTDNLITYLNSEKNANQHKSIASQFPFYIKQFLNGFDKYNDYSEEIGNYASQLNKIRNAGLNNAKRIKEIRAKIQVTQTLTDQISLDLLKRKGDQLARDYFVTENHLKCLLRAHKACEINIVNLTNKVKKYLLKNPSLIHPETDKLFELDSFQQFFNLAPISKKPPLTNSSQPTIRFVQP